jgi:sugar phosphate isomerase/epimerase
MSTSQRPVVERCRPEEATPVRLEADALDSTAPDYLRELKEELTDERLVPARLVVDARFDEDCSLSTQEEAERVREHIRAAAFLGAGTLTVSFDAVANEHKVRPALAACAERARRDGVALEIDGPLALES